MQQSNKLFRSTIGAKTLFLIGAEVADRHYLLVVAMVGYSPLLDFSLDKVTIRGYK